MGNYANVFLHVDEEKIEIGLSITFNGLQEGFLRVMGHLTGREDGELMIVLIVKKKKTLREREKSKKEKIC